jgi:hypothetical protein
MRKFKNVNIFNKIKTYLHSFKTLLQFGSGLYLLNKTYCLNNELQDTRSALKSELAILSGKLQKIDVLAAKLDVVAVKEVSLVQPLVKNHVSWIHGLDPNYVVGGLFILLVIAGGVYLGNSFFCYLEDSSAVKAVKIVNKGINTGLDVVDLGISTVGTVVDSGRAVLELVNASSDNSTTGLTLLNEAIIDSSTAAAVVSSSSTALQFINARTPEQTTVLIEFCHDRGIDFRPNSALVRNLVEEELANPGVLLQKVSALVDNL